MTLGSSEDLLWTPCAHYFHESPSAFGLMSLRIQVTSLWLNSLTLSGICLNAFFWWVLICFLIGSMLEFQYNYFGILERKKHKKIIHNNTGGPGLSKWTFLESPPSPCEKLWSPKQETPMKAEISHGKARLTLGHLPTVRQFLCNRDTWSHVRQLGQRLSTG